MPVTRKRPTSGSRASITVLVSVEGGPNGLKNLLANLEPLTRLYDLHAIVCNNALKSDFSASWKTIQKNGWDYFLSSRKLAPAAYRDWCIQKWATKASTYNFFIRSGFDLPQHFFSCAIKTWGALPHDNLGGLNLIGEVVCPPDQVLPRVANTVENGGKFESCYMVSAEYLKSWPSVAPLNTFRVVHSLVNKSILKPKPRKVSSNRQPSRPGQAALRKAVFFVATTHRPRLLRACLDMLCNQRVPEGWYYEILVGGEPNDSGKSIVKNMQNVRYVDVNTQTVTSKLNALLREAGITVDLILLADDDDIQPLGRLEAAAKAYDEGAHWSGVGEVLFYALDEDRTMRWTGKASQGLVGTSLSFSGEILRKVGGWPERARGKDGPMAAALRKGAVNRPVFKDIGPEMDDIICLQHGSNIWNRTVLEKGQRSNKGSFAILGEGPLDGLDIPEATKKLLRELRGTIPVGQKKAPPPAVPLPGVGRKPRGFPRLRGPKMPSQADREAEAKAPATVSVPDPVMPPPSQSTELIACSPNAPGQSAFADGLLILGFQNVSLARMEHYLVKGIPVLAHGWQKNYAQMGRKYPGLLHVVWHSGYTGSDLMNEGRGLAPALQEARDGAYKLLWLERRDVLLPGMAHMTPVWDPARMRALAGEDKPEKIPNSIMACFHGEYPANAKNVFATLAACAKSGAELHLGDVVSKSRKATVEQILHGCKYQTYSFLKQHDALNLSAKMAMMVHPSVSDTWPYLVMETVYSGTPVILTETISWAEKLSPWAQELCVVRHHTSSREILSKINLLMKHPRNQQKLVAEQQKVLDTLAVEHLKEAKDRLKKMGFPVDAPARSAPQSIPKPTPNFSPRHQPQSMGLREMVRKAGSEGELQEEIRKLEEGVTVKANRPTIMIPSRHRFAARTARILQHLVADYRFLVQTRGLPPAEADLLWSLYPFQDGMWAVNAKQQTGLPFLQTLRGQFWHTGQHNRNMAAKCLWSADHVVTVANSLWDGVLRHYPDLASKSHSVISNGANYLISENPAPVEEFPKPVFLCVTNFNFKEKLQGVEDMVAALDAAGFEGTYLVAGLPGPHSPPPRIGKCGRNIGYYDNVPGLHRMADLFLYLSYMDAQPSSVMEALLAGMVVVVGDTHLTGTSEFIEEGITGRCFKTPEEGVDIALRLMRNKRQREKLGKSAKKLTGKRFTWAKAADAYREIFDRLIREKS